jgi:phospholipid-binding lipoprotein MlaA
MNKAVVVVLWMVPLLAYSSPQSPKPMASESPKAATADAGDDYGNMPEVSDPFESLNRNLFSFNDKFYSWVLTPISKTYTSVVPLLVRKGIHNAFENIKFPVRTVNSGLQGNFGRSGKELQKFVVNTLAGIGGLLRPSDEIPSLREIPAEDFGQTLATWGMGQGPYVVLPILGPATGRETFGLIGDYALNPVNWTLALGGQANDWAWIPSIGNTLQSLPEQLSNYNDSKANAIDPYTAIKSAYVQNRNKAALE